MKWNKWIQVHHNRISDVDNVTVSSKKGILLVDVNDALAILHETTVKHGHFGSINRKVKKEIKV